METVDFSYPCQLRYGWSEVRGCKDNCTRNHHETHGHVHVRLNGLRYRVPFCCESRSGVAAVLQLLVQNRVIDAAMRQAVFTLPAVMALPRTVTANEQRILRSPRLRQRDTALLAG